MTTQHREVPRIAPVGDPDEGTAQVLARTPADASGRPLAIFRTLAAHPRLLKRFNVLGGLFMGHGTLPARERELVVLRVASRSRSEYEWAQHTLIARQVGLTDAEIARLLEPDDPAWSDADRDLIAFVDELLNTVDVGDLGWDRERSRWSDSQLIELVMLVGFYRMTAGFLNAVGVQREAGLPGWPQGARTGQAKPETRSSCGWPRQ